MPWNSNYFPASMKHLPPRVREKAIEIANALHDERMDEGKAIRIAIAKAKEWGRREPAARGPVRSTGIARGESTPEADARTLRSRRRGKEAERRWESGELRRPDLARATCASWLTWVNPGFCNRARMNRGNGPGADRADRSEAQYGCKEGS
ncbi:MAG TPA: hypothetical protein VF420_11100 [Casimicrobiaceae bacterium]